MFLRRRAGHSLECFQELRAIPNFTGEAGSVEFQQPSRDLGIFEAGRYVPQTYGR